MAKPAHTVRRCICGAGVTVVLVAAPAAPARIHAGCNPPGSSTIAQDDVGRFYLSGGYDYYCAFSRRRPHQIGPPARSKDVGHPVRATIAGRYLAFLSFGGRGWGPVVVIDMVGGHQRFSGRAFGPLIRGSFNIGIGPLVLKPDGSVAWIATDHGSGTSEVHRHDSTGTAIVDSGSGIGPDSLAAGGSWLYWTKAGSPRSAQFR